MSTLTVVFDTLGDKDFYKKLIKDGYEYNITAMSIEDEIYRVELIEEAIDLDDSLFIIQELLNASDIQDKTVYEAIGEVG